jgi:hypothetical protein
MNFINIWQLPEFERGMKHNDPLLSKQCEHRRTNEDLAG